MIPNIDNEFLLYNQSYEALWNLVPLEEPQIQLLQVHNIIALRFYQQIRARVGEKINLSELAELGIPEPAVMKLFVLIQLRQGHKAIEFLNYDDASYIVYSRS